MLNTKASHSCTGPLRLFLNRELLVPEEPLVKTLEACPVAGFVFCHLVHGVVDGIVAQLLPDFITF